MAEVSRPAGAQDDGFPVLSLVPGQRVEIHVPEIGTLANTVALASTLV